nr:putative ribonuclease H protein At1g65750 family [Tanacetum cinerariifolium]
MMGKVRFGDKWCKWIKNCLKASSLSILVNGSPTDEFGLERGVRQGDPISLFLFILAVEGLNALVSKAVEKSIFKGVLVGDDRIEVSHLQYADDAIFFGEWSKENARTLMCILKCFEEVSGLRVNYSKSRVYGIGVGSGDIEEMAQWMKCSVGEFPFTYLGLPIGQCMKRSNAWRPVIENFKKRLSDWKAKTMSYGGMFGDGTRDDGKFMVKTLTKMVEEKTLNEENAEDETRWNRLVPKKVNIFVWRAIIGKLPVRVGLDKRGIDLDTILCPCCGDIVESCDHSLILCNMAMSVWEKILNWWKLGMVDAFTIRDMFSHDGGDNFHNYSRMLWQVVTWSTGYFIWKERNTHVFKGKVSSVNKIVQDIKLKSFEWISRRTRKKPFEWQLWLFDPGKCILGSH